MPGFVPIPDSATTGEIAKATNRALERFDSESITKTYNGSNNSPAMIQGRLQYDGLYGIDLKDKDGKTSIIVATDVKNGQPIMKVAKPGFDAMTSDVSNLVFNSMNNLFKIVYTDSVPVTVPSGTPNTWYSGTFQLGSHGLSNPPMVFGSLTASGTLYSLPMLACNPQANGTGVVIYWATLSADSTNVNLRVDYYANGAGQAAYPSISVRYYVVQETAS